MKHVQLSLADFKKNQLRKNNGKELTNKNLIYILGGDGVEGDDDWTVPTTNK